MNKTLCYFILIMFVSGCATVQPKYSFLPPYRQIESTPPQQIELPTDATSFKPVPIEKGKWLSQDGSKSLFVDRGVLYSEKDIINSIVNSSEAKRYKELFSISESSRKQYYGASKEAEEVYQKRIKEMEPGWWDENKFEIGLACGLIGGVLLIWASSYMRGNSNGN